MTTHTLLEELRGLGVKLSTDGTALRIDAPKGVITPDLREQIAAQKQDLIALVAAHGFPAPGDEDEALYLFACAISQMVDVLGGPDNVRIERVDPNVSFQELARESLH